LLDQIKEAFRDPNKIAPPQADRILKECDLLLAAIADCIPASNPKQTALLAKAHNRRGDALLLLDRPAEALEAFNAALALTPDDAYVLYNRGTALIRLDRKDEAKADFTKVASATTKQPGARRLAQKALVEIK
jgi:tetratricopeptide (TPR) repeat protein